MQKYYFTYGTAEHFPFKGGWSVIEGELTEIQARKIFRTIHPDIHENVLNCAFVYTEDEFKNTEMWKNGDNLGNGEMERIEIKIEK